jgi:sugar lactone lactonase YvrE
LKPLAIKQLFNTAVVLFSIACIITACTKKDFPHTYVNVSGSDSAAAALDSLPSFNSPAGIAVDAAGNLYVTDFGNNLIRKITPAGIVSTLAGSGNDGNINAAGILASFNGPTGITIDASGNLFVADAGNNLIREVTSAGVVSTIAGSDSTGFINGIDTSATFFAPTGITVDGPGNLYVADAGNNAIRKITSGAVVDTFAANDTTLNSTVPTFKNPTGIAVDAAGNLYVANYLDNTILKVNPAAAISIYAGTGLQGAANGSAGSATFYYPNSVALDKAGNLYVSDGVNNLIRKITPAGVVSTLAGSGVSGAADSTGTAASFNGPAGLAVDAAGNVYVADSDNNLIRKITPAGVVTTVAGSGLSGAKNGLAVARRNKTRTVNASKRVFNLFYKPKIK